MIFFFFHIIFVLVTNNFLSKSILLNHCLFLHEILCCYSLLFRYNLFEVSYNDSKIIINIRNTNFAIFYFFRYLSFVILRLWASRKLVFLWKLLQFNWLKRGNFRNSSNNFLIFDGARYLFFDRDLLSMPLLN